MNIEPKVIYKVFSGGAYIGLLPPPQNPFSYPQDINTGAAEMVLNIQQTLDMAPEPVEVITDESGDPITTEAGEQITTETAIDIVGVSGSGALIANDNDVQAWGFSDDNPNGKLLFAGYISRWRGIVGRDNTVEVTVTSYGKDLADYVFGNSAFSPEITQATGVGAVFCGIAGGRTYVVQTVLPSSSFDCIKATLSMGILDPAQIAGPWTPTTVLVELCQGTYNGAFTVLSSQSVYVDNTIDLFNTSTYLDYDVVFPVTVPIVSGTQYFLRLGDGSGPGFAVRWSTSDVYAGGSVFDQDSGGIWGTVGGDLCFGLYSGTLLTDASFSAYDPSQMIRDAIDGYRGQGGIVNYTASSIDDTGLSIDYEFKLATILEIIDRARDLAPPNWYWYVDPATQVLYFKELA